MSDLVGKYTSEQELAKRFLYEQPVNGKSLSISPKPLPLRQIFHP